jgi:penicillin-binding protein activator
MRTNGKRIMCAIPLIIGVLAIGLFGGGCSGGKQISRIDRDTVTDLSGRWNDTDSRLVAEEIVAQCFSSPWITNHMANNGGKKPVVIAGAIKNKSTEHIAVGTFLGDIEFALINSQKATVVASAGERGDLRLEKADQWENASPETVKQIGQELGADYMLTGSLDAISDQEKGESTVYYRVDFYLMDIQTNAKIWAGRHEIKKYIGQSKYKP